MRRLWMFFLATMLIVTMSLGVSAATQASQVTGQVTVLTDESCEVVMTATFRLEEGLDDITFPLPVNASNVTLNGVRVGTAVSGQIRQLDIGKVTSGMAGEFTMVITYRLKDVVSVSDEGLLQAKIPLLSGFSYPVENLNITVTMPGEVSDKPAFSSGYHQANIEQDLKFDVDGSVINVTSLAALKDHETLEMRLTVPETLFPQQIIELQDMDVFYLLMGVFAVLAVLYWLIFLRNLPPRFLVAPAPPEGFCAGQMGSVMTLRGADLTMMVFGWAQLGYLQIHTNRSGRVVLSKCMEMGNERSAFEQRCFKNLFGGRATVDATGNRYAELCRKTAAMQPNVQGLVHPKSGSSYVFRVLMALISVFSGICLGLTLSMEAAVQWFPTMLVAAFCGLGSWIIHSWAEGLFSYRRGKLPVVLVVLVLWIILSAVAGTFRLDGWVIFGQLLAGLMSSFGGRRTEAGRQAMSEALGLRRYLRRLSKKQLERICWQNPEYFHAMAPYAIALGVERGFAKRFGRQPLPECPYLSGVAAGRMNADQWCRIMRDTAQAMNAKSQGKVMRDLFGRMGSVRK